MTDKQPFPFLPAVIVAYHGGGDMLTELSARGIPFVRIQTGSDISANKFLAKQHSEEKLLIYQGYVTQLSNELKSLGVTHIIPADEAGVKLTDLLCEALGLPFNGMEKSPARHCY